MMSFRELFRAFFDHRLRLETVNRWSISLECEPWLQGVGSWLFDRVVRVPVAESLLGPSEVISLRIDELASRVAIESLAANENGIWVLAKELGSKVGPQALLEVSGEGVVISSTPLQGLPISAHEACPLQLAAFSRSLWVVSAKGQPGKDGFLYDASQGRLMKISGDELTEGTVSAFLDGRGPGFVQLGEMLAAHRFAPALKECVEWRRFSTGLRLKGCLTRQILPWGEGWLGILVQPSSWREGRWIHRLFHLDSRFALQGTSLPFTLNIRGSIQCQDFSLSPCGQGVLLICREFTDGRLVARSWESGKVAKSLLPCSPGQLEFPTPAALKRLRYLGLKPAEP